MKPFIFVIIMGFILLSCEDDAPSFDECAKLKEKYDQAEDYYEKILSRPNDYTDEQEEEARQSWLKAKSAYEKCQ